MNADWLMRLQSKHFIHMVLSYMYRHTLRSATLHLPCASTQFDAHRNTESDLKLYIVLRLELMPGTYIKRVQGSCLLDYAHPGSGCSGSN